MNIAPMPKPLPENSETLPLRPTGKSAKYASHEREARSLPTQGTKKADRLTATAKQRKPAIACGSDSRGCGGADKGTAILV